MTFSRYELGSVAVVLCGAVSLACAPVEQQSYGLPTTFRDQRITWHDCAGGEDDPVGARLAAVGARCGEFLVPVDYSDPAGATITIAVARRPATDPTRRLGTLVVETGGPGPSRDGVSLLLDGPEGGHAAAPELAERYDLVGMDPRFFGASSPLECGWPTGEYLGLAQAAPTDGAGVERALDTARGLADRCAPWRHLLPHASTRAAARDLDVLRTLLGESSLSYLGWSWGTYLGAVYAQLFGDRVDRMVLDSPLDPAAAGPDLTRYTAAADAAALADWARWAAERNAELGLGATTAAVLGTVDALIARVADEPIVLGGVTVTAELVPGLLLTVDDSTEAYTAFTDQFRALSDAADGLPIDPPPALAAKLALYADPGVTPEFGFSATVANQCADRAARPAADYAVDITNHQEAEPLFGALARHPGPCAFWPVAPAEPATVIANDTPALLVGADGDPVAPAAGVHALTAAMPAARSVTLRQAFRHGVYLFDRSACVDSAVTAYLLDGALPATAVSCTRDDD
ncbi:alpha/beta hydrolase [Nocardia asteroides]|uniref:alpha/beta hydrolase n=1 Tax=Nocardia asteroides TaxID=1824 RepID=UPI001E3C64AC|nr:alpha/beta hydrolase [Nocardia asteroides]UGT57014.1 alpha/beta hydrolase [Nocardia asteroides]